MRHAARTDRNQAEIVAALRDAGALVWVIGLPVDLLVGYRGRLCLMECKDGAKSSSRQRKTALQAEFFANWGECPISLVDSAEAALRALRVLAA